NLDKLDEDDFKTYAKICGLLLARGHAQSPTAAIVHGYVGTKKKLVSALINWADDYSKQVHKDYQEFLNSLDADKTEE
ncbi:DUF2252 family protein, partial [Lactococcus lactis]